MNRVSQFLPEYYAQEPDRFFWPVNRNNVVKVRDKFLLSLLEHVKQSADADPYTQYYYIMSLNWSNHIVQFYHFLKAKKEFEKKGIEPYLDGDSGFFKTICDGKKPPMPPYLDLYYQGTESKSLWLEPLRLLRANLVSDGLSRKPLCMVNFEKDIIVNSTGPLVFKHAKSIDERVFYLPRSVWFKPVDAMPHDHKIDTDILIDMVRDSFGEDADLLTRDIEEWFAELFSKTLYVCDIHVKRLLANPKKLPKKFWMGSGGIFWDRMLKYAVKKLGGHVTGHDHGSGAGHVKSVSRTIGECIDCDVFVPFSRHSHLFTDAIQPEFLLDGHIPKVKTLEFSHHSTEPVHTKKPQNNPPKILIIPYGPDQNVPRFLTVPHDSVKTDFLVRTIKQLKEWGYHVSIKPHPHCPKPLTNECLEELGCGQMGGSINDAFEGADIILFSSIYTTTFREAFDANKPIVLIDMHYEQWVPGAREKLLKRCAVVDGDYDENGRIHFDWGTLKEAIEVSPSKDDTSYYDTYYNDFL